MRDLGALPPGSHLVLGFMLPAEFRDDAGQTYVDLVGPNAAERGEPWRSFWSPDEMVGALAGFGPATTISQHDILTEPRTDALKPARLTPIAHAVRGESGPAR